MQAALAKDTGTLSDKFAGLARVRAGKYDWKPGTGMVGANRDLDLEYIRLWAERLQVIELLATAFRIGCAT